jgi:hypothetical protein
VVNFASARKGEPPTSTLGLAFSLRGPVWGQLEVLVWRRYRLRPGR